MEEMINSDLVKALRLKKSWSQEKLATASGLSLRTVQRAENSGTSSLETKLALSAALNIPAEKLMPISSNSSKTPQNQNTVIYGYIGAGIGLVCSYSAITYSVIHNILPLGEAGLWYGIIGAFTGITCGAIGFLKQRGYVA